MMSKLKYSQAITTVVVILFASGCATTKSEAPPATLTIQEALGRLGSVEQTVKLANPAGTIVVMKDRHSVRPGFHRVRPQLRQVHKDNRLALQFLVSRGFGLLGCEQTFGEIDPKGEYEQQFKVVSASMYQGSDLDEYSVFQPIRYQLLWSESLSVWGVEDPELFQQDINDFRAFAEARQRVKRHDLDPNEKRQLQEVLVAAYKKLGENIASRGRAAADNLLDLMFGLGVDHAVLLVGGAHSKAVLEVLSTTGYDVYLFQSSRYADEASQPDRRRR